jgi:23S rRNA pseudouridine1911/1915/1917 synthase
MSRLPILFEDAHLVAIDKPAGLPSVESEGERGRTCLSELRASRPSALAVHRLDRDVSGVMLFALDEPTRAALERQFRERSLDKTYLAVVNGVPRPERGTIRKTIADLGKHAAVGRGAPAVTHYEVVERFGARGRGLTLASLVEVRLETGRYNQIRLHFASIGHPLVGERKYARGRDSAVRFRRVALHAWKLSFRRPGAKEAVELEAPLPDDLARLLDELRAR